MTIDGVSVHLLGPFQVLKTGQAMSLRPGGKAEQLLTCLALRPRVGMSRASIVERIWPDSPVGLAGGCLNSLVRSLKENLADALAGQSPIIYSQGHYALNLDSGVEVDLLEFESAVSAGHRFFSTGSTAAAIRSYERAVDLYRGDLVATSDISELLERERFRASCLTTLARLADAHFQLEDYEHASAVVVRLLGVDPCREDAHRMLMRLYVRLGARAQALRQYDLCRLVLREEFDAAPEPATDQLFELIRSDPGQV